MSKSSVPFISKDVLGWGPFANYTSFGNRHAKIKEEQMLLTLFRDDLEFVTNIAWLSRETTRGVDLNHGLLAWNGAKFSGIVTQMLVKMTH